MDLRKLTWSMVLKDGVTPGIKDVEKSLAGLSKSMTTAGKSLTTKVTLPLVGIGTAALKTVSGFDDAMSQVQAVSGATGTEMEKLRKQAQQLGSETAHSASDAADGMGVLAAAGLDTNAILGASGNMLNLMSAGAVDADTAASVLTNTMAQFGVASNEAGTGYIVDTFAKAASSAKLGVSDLEYAMAQAGGTMASMNMSVTGATAAIGHLANAGMPIGQVGTALNAMGREVKANADEFKKLGIDVYDPITGDMMEMGMVMGELEQAIAGKTDAERDAILSTVFSGQAMKAATDWLSLGTDAYDELTESIFESEGAAEHMAGVMEDNFGGAMRGLSAAMEGLMIEIGDVVKDDIRALADGVAGLVRSFSELDDGTKKTIIRLAGVAVATGPLLLAGGKLIDTGFKIKKGIGMLGGAMKFMTGPVGVAIALIGGLILAGVHLYRNNEEVRDKIQVAWAGIQNTVTKVAGIVQAVWGALGDNIIGAAQGVWNALQSVATGIISVVSGAVQLVSSILSGDWASAWEGAKGIVTGVVGGIIGAVKGMVGVITNAVGIVGKGLKSIGGGIKSAGGWVKNKVTGKGADGSHAGGLDNVPFDGYIGELHQDEMVLTKENAQKFRALGGTATEFPDIERSVIKESNTNATTTNNNSNQNITFNPSINIEVKGNATEETARDISDEVVKVMNKEFKKLLLQMS